MCLAQTRSAASDASVMVTTTRSLMPHTYKNVVRLTFAKGASLKDPARLFNSSLDGNVRRAIDIHEGGEVDESAFKALVRQAVALNSSGRSKPSKNAKS